MKHNAESGGDDDSAERAWEAIKQEPPSADPLLAHWEGFITHMEAVWEITFADLKFGEQIGVGAFQIITSFFCQNIS